MAESFGERLAVRIKERGPLCVGIDPSREQLSAWGRGDDITGLEFFMLQMLEASSGVAAAIKPQVAFFERFGSKGFAALERLIKEAASADVLIVGDAKRGDIGSTNDGYADAWLRDNSPLAVDALTVTPYLGLTAMNSLFAQAESTGRGVFVVVASSNDEGRPVQMARTNSGESVEDFHFRLIAERNEASGSSIGSIGAVVGATRQTTQFALEQMRGPFLVPGVGAQGATPGDVGRLFGACPKGTVLVNASRSVAGAGPERRAIEDAARRLRDDLASALL
jgi:orotidine-5'-phosphate decarboxylase